MLQHLPPKGIDITVVNKVIDRYAKTIITDKDTEIVGTVMVVKDISTVDNDDYQLKAHCIVAQLDDTGFADVNRHAHYDIYMSFRLVLVPCPDSHTT